MIGKEEERRERQRERERETKENLLLRLVKYEKKSEEHFFAKESEKREKM